jgi:transcriptional regulator with XRE-family HTH domain
MILNQLRLTRKQLGLSIEDIARNLGASQPSVSRWLRGKGLTLTILDDLCRCMGTDLLTLVEQAGNNGPDRFTLRQEKILASDRRLSLMFFLILHGAQRKLLMEEFQLPPQQLDDCINRLVQLALIDRATGDRLRPIVSRSIRWQPNGPLAAAFKATVLPMLLGTNFGAKGTHYVSQFALLDEDGLAFVQSRFEALCQEILRGTGEVASASAGRQWSTIFMMARPVAIDELQAWVGD